MLVKLKEDPLGPLVVLGVGGVDLPVPVKGIAQHLELPPEVLDIIVRHLGGMDVVFDGVILCGQAKGVVSHGEKNVIAIHPAFARHHVHSGVGAGMPHMEPLTGGIRELYQRIEFRFVAAVILAVEGLLFQPFLLPLGFDAGKIVLHLLHFLVSYRPAGAIPAHCFNL